MSKWIAETSGLSSKEQLKATRNHILNSLMVDKHLSQWCDADKARQAELFAEADAEYERRKAALLATLKSLSSTNLKKYFKEIEIAPQDIETWLVVS